MEKDYTSEFFNVYFDKRYVFMKNSATAEEASRLLNYDKFENILWLAAKFKLSNLQIAKNSILLPEREKKRLDIIRHLPRLLDEGYSIAINYAEEFDPELARFSRRIGHIFRSRSNLSIFLSPTSAPAFEAHTDAVDVVAVQVEGSKRWQIGQHDPFPLKGKTFVHGDMPTLDIDLLLNPGDSLYVPRGCVHRVQASGDKPSLHISVAIETLEESSVFGECLQIAREKITSLRGSYYSRGDFSGPKFDGFYSAHNCTLAAARIRSRQLSGMSQLPGRLSTLASSFNDSPFSATTMVRRRADTHCEVLLDTSNLPRAILSFPGLGAGRPDLADASVSFPGITIRSLEFIRDVQGPFSVQSLPGDADLKLKESVVRRLHQDGLLEVVPKKWEE